MIKYLLLQIPREVPHQTEPVDFTSVTNVVVYLGVPILLLGFYVIWRRRKTRAYNDFWKKQEEEARRESEATRRRAEE